MVFEAIAKGFEPIAPIPKPCLDRVLPGLWTEMTINPSTSNDRKKARAYGSIIYLGESLCMGGNHVWRWSSIQGSSLEGWGLSVGEGTIEWGVLKMEGRVWRARRTSHGRHGPRAPWHARERSRWPRPRRSGGSAGRKEPNNFNNKKSDWKGLRAWTRKANSLSKQTSIEILREWRRERKLKKHWATLNFTCKIVIRFRRQIEVK